jgi:threonine synthase
MGVVALLRCVRCDCACEAGAVECTCSYCGIDGLLDLEYDYERIAGSGFGKGSLVSSRDFSVWQYKPLAIVVDGRVFAT